MRSQRAPARSPPPMGGQGAPRAAPRTLKTRQPHEKRRWSGRARVGAAAVAQLNPTRCRSPRGLDLPRRSPRKLEAKASAGVALRAHPSTFLELFLIVSRGRDRPTWGNLAPHPGARAIAPTRKKASEGKPRNGGERGKTLARVPPQISHTPTAYLRRRECQGQTVAAADPGANRSRLLERPRSRAPLGGVPGCPTRWLWVYRCLFRGIEKGEQAPPSIGSS